MAIPTAEQIALVKQLLPSTAEDDYDWTDSYIQSLMDARSFSPAEAVRFFWLQRVNETSEYLDINGKPLTQIHAAARDMLNYWDSVVKASGATVSVGGDAIGPNARRPLSFGMIERPTG